MVRQVEDLLRDLGWTEGFHIPVANDENKSLEEKVERGIKQKGELTIKSEDITDCVTSLTKHTSHVKNELVQNQGIISAHKKQVETEENLYKLAQAEQVSYEREMKLINKAFQELGERHFALQNGIIAHTEKLEKLKANVKWDKDALLSWEEEVARGEEDNQLLAKYTADDESKAKELELTRLRLSKEADERNQLLLAIIGEVETLERVLDRTAQAFRKAHIERQEFIQQWEGSVRVLQGRDTDIHNRLQEIGSLRAEARVQVELLREQKEFVKNEINNNKEADLQINQANRNCVRLRADYNKLISMVNDFTSDLAVMQRTLANASYQLEYKRTRNKKITADLTVKENRIESLKEVIVSTKERYDEVTNRTTCAADRARYLEEMIQNEEKTMEILVQDTRKLNELLFRAQQEMFNLKKEEEQQKIDIQGFESSKALVTSHLTRVEKELERQKEMIYTKEYEAQSIESKIDHLSGVEIDYDKKERDEKRLAQLEEILAEKIAIFNVLTTQNQRLEDRMRRITKALNADAIELEKLTDKQQDQILLTEGGQKQLKQKKAQNQEKQVEENVLRLRVAQAEKAIVSEGDKVYSLEKQRLELEAAMKERQVEIGVNTDVLTVQKRKLEEEKSHLVTDIKACEFKTNQLQSKYETFMNLLGKTEDGEPLSVTYFKIQKAQEKYELQKEGDKLDEKIRRTEKEILAMENTLKVINAANETYKKNLAAVDEESDEYKEKKNLETQYYAAVDKLRVRKSELTDLNNQIQVIEQALEEIFMAEGELRATWRNKDQDAIDLDRDLKEQASKLRRAEKQLRNISREIQGASQTKITPIEEKDIETRELQEQNQSALQQLAEIVARHIEAGPVVTRYLEEKGLCLPVSRSPGGSLTYASSRDRLKLSPSGKSSRISLLPPGSPASSVLCVPALTSSQLSVRSLASIGGSSASSRSSQNAASATVINLDSAQLEGVKPKKSEKGLCGTAASLKRKTKKD